MSDVTYTRKHSGWPFTEKNLIGEVIELPRETHEALLAVVEAAQAVKDHDDNDPRPLRPTLEVMYGALHQAGIRGEQ